jgi:hypothetical protein
MFVERNIEARSRNHSYRGKAKSMIFSECVCSLSSPASNKNAPYYIVMWPAFLYRMFLHNVINGTVWNTVTEHEMCVF